MSEARQLEHSPGPFAYLTCEEGHYILDAEGNCIADLIHSPHHADGHLMAAAPDMLRLLRVVCDPYNTWPEMSAAINEGRGIIRRLDGQQP